MASRAGPRSAQVASTIEAPYLRESQAFEQTKTRSSAVYAYTAPSTANTTRLLHILPGGPDDPLSCTIEFCCLDDAADTPQYKAISYHWGKQERDLVMTLNGRTHFITLNVALVLLHMRKKDFAQTVWIDSICIDQGNEDEKIQQVQIMDLVYETAQETVAWMGILWHDDERALDFLEKHQKLFYDVASDESADIRSLLAHHDLDPGAYWWIDVMELTCRPWFSRVWVVQEVALSRSVTVTYGPRSIPWEVLTGAIKCCASDIVNLPGRRSNFRSFPEYRSALMMSDVRKAVQRTKKISMETALKISGCLRATRPHDFVFALLGLLDKEHRARLPDLNYYSKVADVFAAATRIAIEESEDLSLLCRAELSPVPMAPGVPSWVPDFYDFRLLVHQPLGLDSRAPSSVVSAWCSNGFQLPRPQFCGDNMSVYGVLLDDISFLSPIYTDETDWTGDYRTDDEDLAKKIIEWNDKEQWLLWTETVIDAALEGSNDEAEEILITKLATTLCGNSFDSPELCKQRFITWLQLFLCGRYNASGTFINETMNVLRNDWRRDVAEEEKEQANRYAADFERMCCGRRFCITAGGNFGIVPRTGKIGDKVSVLARSSIPFLLRSPGGNSSFEQQLCLVGSCYINGLLPPEGLDSSAFVPLTLI